MDTNGREGKKDEPQMNADIRRLGVARRSAASLVRPTQPRSGGVTRSLSLDAHGKTLSSALLDLELSR